MDDANTTSPIDSNEQALGLKKYIRTFGGDFKTLQEGGVPELVPLVDASAAVSSDEPISNTTPVPAAPIAPLPPPAPVAPPAPLAVPTRQWESSPSLQQPNPIFSSLHEPDPDVAPLETYAGDFNDKVKETHASVATVLAAEQDAPRSAAAPEEEHGGKGLGLIIGGVVLLGIAGAGIAIAYSQYASAIIPVIIQPTAATPIFVDSSENISGSGTTLMQAIEQAVGDPIPANTVELLSLAQATTSGMTVFAALNANAPDALLRNLHSDGSMAGIVNTGTSQSPFFILSVDSYSVTFSSMLSWEPTMQGDLAALFPLYTAISVGTEATTTTATTTITVPVTKAGFRDEVVSNHDVRVYRDAAGNILLLYGYWDQATLVIARDSAAFTEILQRLASTHTP